MLCERFLENCNEICGNEEAINFFYQNFDENKKKSEAGIFDYFVEVCEMPSSIKIDYTKLCKGFLWVYVEG